jgi:hypothetical protein
VQVDELQARELERHGVDREVAPDQVVGKAATEGDLRLAGLPVIDVGAVGRDLDDGRALAQADGAEVAADLPVRVSPPSDEGESLVGAGVGREV